ncbi:MAG: lipopolysaccharide/colanic/teichoic acid biosynthesis glycosyltransferase [Flavobacterium sp.]|jgi:lipopolysaccharide/colanic/teichoic acid biosynthesis glycosyltransferase
MVLKRIFDIIFSLLAIIFMGWIVLIAVLIASFDTNSFGLFFQERVGQYGKLFKIFKIKSMNDTTHHISSFGRFLRQSKLDELPQLLNILIGQMSFVGPRPDVPGYYDKLAGENRKILALKPGLTSEASIKYANEEALLKQQDDPLAFNDAVIFPDKVKINLNYFQNRTIFVDLLIIFKTVFR